MSTAGFRQAVARNVEGLARIRSHPLSAAELARPAVVFAPHQDDETLGCGGLIALKRQLGTAVDVVFVTDGRTSHAKFIGGDAVAARRRDEALAACAALGVPADAVIFLDFPDGELGQHRERAAAAIGDLLPGFVGRQVCVPYAGDMTPDHMDTRGAVRDALTRPTAGAPWTVLEYPVWFWHHWPWVMPPLVRRLHLPGLALRSAAAAWHRLADLTRYVDITAVQGAKAAALACHRTQMERSPEHPGWPVLADVADGDWLATCTREREYFHRYELGASGA